MQLGAAGVTLVAAPFIAEAVVTQTLVYAVSALYLGYAALFLLIGLRSGIPGAWHKLGQWMAFLPVGVFGVLAS